MMALGEFIPSFFVHRMNPKRSCWSNNFSAHSKGGPSMRKSYSVDNMKTRSYRLPGLLLLYCSSFRGRTGVFSLQATGNTCSGCEANVPETRTSEGTSWSSGRWVEPDGMKRPIHLIFPARGPAAMGNVPLSCLTGTASMLPGGKRDSFWTESVLAFEAARFFSNSPGNGLLFRKSRGGMRGNGTVAGSTRRKGLLKESVFPVTAPSLLGLAALLMRRHKR